MIGSPAQASDGLIVQSSERIGETSARARGSWVTQDRNVFAIAALLALGMLTFTAWIIVSDHRDARARAELSLGNIVGTIEKDIDRNIELYGLAIQETLDALPLPGLAAVPPDIRHAAMFSRIARAEYMSSILVIGPDGEAVADSANITPRQVNLADQEYFRALRDHPTDALYISRPVSGRVDDQFVLVFARRIDGPDGRFAGVVAGSVQLEYFRQLFSTLTLGEGGAISLLRTDGYVLARFPVMPGEKASNLAGTEPLGTMLQNRAGIMDGVSTIDGMHRIYAYRRVGTLPLLVTASFGKTAVFAAWQRKAVLVMSAVGVLVGFAGLLLFALRRQLVLRESAERRALASAERARRSERSLALSLDRLDVVFQHSADIQFAASPRADGCFAYDSLNHSGEVLTGLRASAIIGRTPGECFAPDVAMIVLNQWEHCLRSGDPTLYDQTLDLPIGRRHLETHLVPVFDADGEIRRLIGTTRDVTIHKQAEESLRSLNGTLERRAAAATAAHDHALIRASASERLQLLGQLASGIAHDVNNVLQSVAGCASMIDRRADEPETMRRASRFIADAAERGGAITQRLLAFARQEAGSSERIMVAPLFADLLEIMRHTLRGAAPLDIQAHVDGDGLTVFAAAKQLETVLLNLATNARDAMPKGGTLTLGAATTDSAGLSLDDYVRLWVRDEGTGIDGAIIGRVTEPFFTTKPVGEGTGLGLSMASEFARESGGTLTIDSTPGRGTTVSLLLPR